MAEEKVDGTDWKAVNMLTDRFSLYSEHIQDFLELTSGDQVIVKSAPLVVRELGEGPCEGTRQYLQDALEPAKKIKKLDQALQLLYNRIV